MSLRTRLLATFALVALLLAIPAFFAAERLAVLRDFTVDEGSRRDEALASVAAMETARLELARTALNWVDQGDRTFGAQTAQLLSLLDAEVRGLAGTRYGGPVERVVRPSVDSLRALGRRLDELVQAGDREAGFELLYPDPDPDAPPAPFDTQLSALGTGLAEVRDSIAAMAQVDFARASEISASARGATLGALAVALFLAVLAGAWTTGALVLPLRRLARATTRVAEGSYETPSDLPYDRRDEVGRLSRSFRTMTRRLGELDRMKAEFIGVASHELKTPINVIRGYTQLIEEEIAGEVTEEQAEILGAIAEQTRRMSRLVSRLMDISRLEAGTYTLEVETVRTEDLVTGLLRSFDILAANKQIDLRVDRADSMPREVTLDVDLVRDEVLGNILSNAVKHTPEGGRIDLRTWGEGGQVVFEIADSGPGIPAEHAEHIFEKYYQVERSRRVGSGLGLAVAREMVEAHGGTIELDRSATPGATFRVRLPVQASPAREPQIAAGAR